MADGQECVETFCDGPRQSLLLCFVLDIACGQVNAEKIACNVIENLCIGRLQILQPVRRLANDETELDFMMQTDSARPYDGSLVGQQNGRRRLEEEEGLRRTSRRQLGYVITATSQQLQEAFRLEVVGEAHA